MRFRHLLLSVAATLPMFAYGCAAPSSDDDDGAQGGEDAYTSASAKLLDFEFEGEVTLSGGDPQQTIKDQMLFTIGQLNGKTGVGRLDKLAITNVRSDRQGDLTRVRYHAKLPVSIAKTARVSRSYTLILPKRADYAGQDAFFTKYGSSQCTDPYAHDNETGIYWYYYRPEQAGCTLAAEDVIKAKATVRVSPENTKNTYPEYDKLWSDGVLNVVSIFGKFEDGATTDADVGIKSHGDFVSTMRHELPNAKVTPASTPEHPGIANADVTIESTLPNGKKLKITSFLVDNVREGGAAFERRYNELSGDADVIVYNGHAGLGQNVRALAHMGTFKPGKYQIVYMNGCDTFAYVDGTLAETRARLNPTDPTGTKFMEILTNSMPPNWESLPNNTMSLIRDLSKLEAPVKYTDILAHFDQSGFVTVTGDEDNTFKP
jgi:hypothetical protein